jgi:hypothetical protein
MDTFEWAAAILAVTICFGPGLAAVTTAWLFPWLRGSIARPRLWGWGELMLGLFFTMQLMDQTVVSTPPTAATCSSTEDWHSASPACI